jgi:hypothetical protein
MGDFAQLAPVGKESDTLFAAANAGATQAGLTFRDFDVVTLTEQMRADADEVQHRAILERLADIDIHFPVTQDMINTWRVINASDFLGPDGDAWRTATIVVSTNATRMQINNARMIAFARESGVPVLSWRLPLRGAERRDPGCIALIYATFPELTVYFVPGAPAVITANQNVSKRVANGTRAVMHSVVFPTNIDVANMKARVRGAAAGEIILLDCVPEYVNMKLVGVDPLTWPANETMVPGDVVVPLPALSTTSESMSLAKLNIRTFTVSYTESSFDPAYAVTYYKVQGLTVDYIILDLTYSIKLNLQALFVAVSRVRRGAKMRILNSPTGHLLRFKHNLQYVTWCKSLAPAGGTDAAAHIHRFSEQLHREYTASDDYRARVEHAATRRGPGRRGGANARGCANSVSDGLPVHISTASTAGDGIRGASGVPRRGSRGGARRGTLARGGRGGRGGTAASAANSIGNSTTDAQAATAVVRGRSNARSTAVRGTQTEARGGRRGTQSGRGAQRLGAPTATTASVPPPSLPQASLQ